MVDEIFTFPVMRTFLYFHITVHSTYILTALLRTIKTISYIIYIIQNNFFSLLVLIAYRIEYYNFLDFKVIFSVS